MDTQILHTSTWPVTGAGNYNNQSPLAIHLINNDKHNINLNASLLCRLIVMGNKIR